MIRRLIERGAKCKSFDLVPADDRPEEVKFFQGDVRYLEAVKEASAGVDIVFHNVAHVPLTKDKELSESVNIPGTRNLLEAALTQKVRKVVYTSSSAVFGAVKSNPVTEDTVLTPGEAYGRAKYEGEKLCLAYRDKGLNVSIIRPLTIMGHGRLSIFQILFEWIREGRNVPVLGKGDNVYQFVHADDLAQACILAALRPGGETYNCGTDRFGTMRASLQQVCDHAGNASKVISVPMAPAVWGMKISTALGISPPGAYHALTYGRSLYFDITKTKTGLGWQPKYSNNEMFAQSRDWYLENREAVLRSPGPSHHRSAVKQGVLNIVKRLL